LKLVRSIGERVGAELEVEGDQHRALAAFLGPWRAVAARHPYPAAFPSAIGVVDAPLEALGIKAQLTFDAGLEWSLWVEGLNRSRGNL
jgi:hypothetical protein